MNSELKPWQVFACLLATWIFWGSTYLAIKFALLSFPPFFQMGTRFLAAGLLLMAWARWHRSIMPTLIQWRNAAVVGALMLGGGMGGTAYAEQYVASGLVVAFIAVVPAMIAIINYGFGVRPGQLEIAGICVGVLGVICLVGGAGFKASPEGLTSIILATICWSTGSVLSLRVFSLAPGAAGFASEMLCGGAILMAISLISGEPVNHAPQMVPILAWMYLVVFGSIIAFSAYMTLLSRTSATLAASYSFVNPLIAMMLGIGIAGERVTTREWLAAAIIIVGVILLLAGRSRRGSISSPPISIPLKSPRV